MGAMASVLPEILPWVAGGWAVSRVFGSMGPPGHAPDHSAAIAARQQELQALEARHRQDLEDSRRREQELQRQREEVAEQQRQGMLQHEQRMRDMQEENQRQANEQRVAMERLLGQREEAAALGEAEKRRVEAESEALRRAAEQERERRLEEQARMQAEMEECQRQAERQQQQLQEAIREKQAEAAKLQQEMGQVQQAREEEQRKAEEFKRQAAIEWPRPEWVPEGEVSLGVTGRSGVGKSSLINAVLGKKPEDPGAAPVGVEETTIVPKGYTVGQGPLNGLRLVDLPGAGTRNFPSVTYIKRMGLRYFSALMIVTACRFEEMDLALFEEATRWGIPCYLVRSKVDIDMANNQVDHRRAPEETLQQLRTGLVAHVAAAGQPAAAQRVFVVSARSNSGFDGTLRDDLERLVRAVKEDVERGLQTR